MDYDEEQRNELEALEAIFGEDFELHSADAPRSFELLLVPNADGVDNHVTLRLKVSFPSTYPEVPADIRLQREKGLVERQMADLHAILAERSASSVGEVAIYTIAEGLKEYLLDHNKPELTMHEQMAARALARDTEEEDRISKRKALEERIEAKKLEPSPLGIEPGTLLTPETFAHWRGLFDAEQKAIREAKEAARPTMNRITGKQLFMQNLAKDLEESDADALVEEVIDPPAEPAAVWFDAKLYQDEPDEDDETVDRTDHADDDDDDDEADAGADDEEITSMFDTAMPTAISRPVAPAAAASSSASAPAPAPVAAASKRSPPGFAGAAAAAPAPAAAKPAPAPAAKATPPPAAKSAQQQPKAAPAAAKPQAKKEAPKKEALKQQKGKDGKKK